MSLFGCTAYNHRECYRRSLDSFTFHGVTFFFTIRATSSVKHVPGIMHRYRETGPYFFNIEASQYFQVRANEEVVFTVKKVRLLKTNMEHIDIVNNPITIHLKYDEWWNDTYSKTQNQYLYHAIWGPPLQLPINFKDDREFDMSVTILLKTKDVEVETEQVVHFKAEIVESKSSYWEFFMTGQ
jgi:hypothetical protein